MTLEERAQLFAGRTVHVTRAATYQHDKNNHKEISEYTDYTYQNPSLEEFKKEK